MTYHSPFKFRHGHAVYALKMARDIVALKAVSQNLMHSNISITDGGYGILSKTDIREEITTLGKGHSQNEIRDIRSLIQLAEKILEEL